MPKLKTKSSAKKRFKVTGTGKIKFFSAFLRHNTFKRPAQMKRQNRGGQIMSEVNARVVRKYFFHI